MTTRTLVEAGRLKPRVTVRAFRYRPHFYELAVAINVVLVHSLFYLRNFHVPPITILDTFRNITPFFLLWMLGGLVGRSAVAAAKGQLRTYWKRVVRASWIIESVRLIFFGTLAVHVYCWLKISLPISHPRLYDELLWDLDRMLFFGHSPNVLFIELFSNSWALRVVDLTYDQIFRNALILTLSLALSSTSDRLRIAFLGTKAIMWIVGAWLYLSLPSLGPAYRFPEVWQAYHADMRITMHWQTILLNNYRAVLHMAAGGPSAGINLTYGIAAFPSLHVAFQVFVALWVRRFSKLWGIVAEIAAVIIFVGSVVTGWHYLIDSLAGLVLAWVFYWAVFKWNRLERWIALARQLVSRPKSESALT